MASTRYSTSSSGFFVTRRPPLRTARIRRRRSRRRASATCATQNRGRRPDGRRVRTLGSAAGDLGAILAAGTTRPAPSVRPPVAASDSAADSAAAPVSDSVPGRSRPGRRGRGRLHRRLRLRRRHRRCPRGGAGGRWLDRRAVGCGAGRRLRGRSGTGRRTDLGPGDIGGSIDLGGALATDWVGCSTSTVRSSPISVPPERGVRGRGQLGSGWTPVGRRRVERALESAFGIGGALVGELGAALGAPGRGSRGRRRARWGLGAGFDAALDSALALGGSLGGALGGDLAAQLGTSLSGLLESALSIGGSIGGDLGAALGGALELGGMIDVATS